MSGQPRTTRLDDRSADLGFRSNFAAYAEAGANHAPRGGCGMPRAGAARPEALSGEIGLCGPDLVRLDPGVVIPEGAAAATVTQRRVTTMICQRD